MKETNKPIIGTDESNKFLINISGTRVVELQSATRCKILNKNPKVGIIGTFNSCFPNAKRLAEFIKPLKPFTAEDFENWKLNSKNKTI